MSSLMLSGCVIPESSADKEARTELDNTINTLPQHADYQILARSFEEFRDPDECSIARVYLFIGSLLPQKIALDNYAVVLEQNGWRYQGTQTLEGRGFVRDDYESIAVSYTATIFLEDLFADTHVPDHYPTRLFVIITDRAPSQGKCY